jgi:hypothetical protein
MIRLFSELVVSEAVAAMEQEVVWSRWCGRGGVIEVVW